MFETDIDSVFFILGIIIWFIVTPITFYQMKKYMDVDKDQKYFILNILLYLINMFITIFMFGIIYGHFGVLDSSNDKVYGVIKGIYFSIATWTTLGYGDLHPPDNLKIVTSIEALLGYIYLGILVGIIMNKLLHSNLGEKKMNTEENHVKESDNKCQENNKDKNHWWKKPEITVSIASLLVTPIFSFIVALSVVNLQLSKEHSFYEGQQQVAKEQAKVEQKIRLHSKTISLLGVTSSSRLASAVTHLYAAIELKYLLDGLENYREVYNQSTQEFADLLHETRKNSSDMRSTLEIAKFYFNIETQDSINEFFEYSLSNPTVTMPNVESIIAEFKLAKNNGVPDVKIVEQLQDQLESTIKDDRYINLGHKVTNAMMNEIASDLKLVALK